MCGGLQNKQLLNHCLVYTASKASGAHLVPHDTAGGPSSEQNSTSRRGPPHGAVPHSCSYARAASLHHQDVSDVEVLCTK